MATRRTEAETTQEVTITREFDAPRALVWKAWTEPERLMKWWGPATYTAPAITMDVRQGGDYLWCMRSPEGDDVWNTGHYRVVIEPERIVYTASFADAAGKVVPATHYGIDGDFAEPMVVTVTFEERAGKTLMTLRHAGLPAGEMGESALAGWSESFDKLAASLR